MRVYVQTAMYPAHDLCKRLLGPNPRTEFQHNRPAGTVLQYANDL